MGTKVKEQDNFTLPNKKIKVKFIHRKRGMASGKWVSEDHAISGGMLNTAIKSIPAPIQKNGAIANVLTKAEKAYLEDLMQIELSVYKNKEFWEEKDVMLRKSGNLLDLSDPIDYIDYKILLANKDLIAPSLKEQNNKLTYLFVLVEEGEEDTLKRSSFNYKKKAFKLYSKIEDNADILRGIIKIIEKKPLSVNTKLEWLQGRVEDIIDNKPGKFVSLLEDSNYETKILLAHAQDESLIIVQNKRYMTSDGIELCEEGEVASYDNAVRYLSKPTNQELVDIIKLKLEKL